MSPLIPPPKRTFNYLSARERLSNVLEHIQYKPGWKIYLHEHPIMMNGDSMLLLVIDYTTFDFNFYASQQEKHIEKVRTILQRSCGMDPPEVGRFRYTREISKYDIDNSDERFLMMIITDTIKQVENHEFERWFRVDGTKVYDSGREI